MSGLDRDTVTAADAAAEALAAQDGGPPLALVTVVSAPLRAAVGRRMLVGAEGERGKLGSAELERRAAALARDALRSGRCGISQVEMETGVWELYVEPQRALPELLIVGAGHVGRALHSLGAMLGFRVTVVDDRPEYADAGRFPEAARVLLVEFRDAFKNLEIGPDTYIVLVTRGHKYDYDCIQQLLTRKVQPAYLGMIGSRRRVRAAFEALIRDGIEPERLSHVRAPIGLDIGSETPEEIALAIAAEIVAVRRGREGGTMSARESVLGRVARTRGEEGGDH